jgi:hypothetical protein
MKHRKLRVAWSVAWGVVAVLLVVLWVRSYWWMDVVRRVGSGSSAEFRSNGGSIFIFYETPLYWLPSPPRGSKWEFTSYLASPRWHRVLAAESSIRFPCGLTVLLAGLLATVPWIRWSRRFSLRTLLIAITLAAIGLGTIVVRWR